MRRFAPLLVVVASISGGAPASTGPSPLDRCASLPAGGDRGACLRQALVDRSPDRADLEVLDRLLEGDPSAVESAAAAATAAAGTSPALRADLLDLRGRALSRLGRPREAAASFESALALDDGTTRLTWCRDGQPLVWTAALDAGNGRLDRAAKALLDAADPQAARPLIAKALPLGSGGDVLAEWKRTARGSAAGLDAPVATALEAPRWFEPVPDVSIPLLDGGKLSLTSLRGKVVLLDFWASWCAPCMEELPKLQALLAELEPEGLAAIAVNGQETVDIARRTTRALRLSMPVGRYDRDLDTAFIVRNLPTAVLIDRQGRVRARWDGFYEGIDKAVRERARALLGADSEAAPVHLGEVLAGAGTLVVSWLRELDGPVGGLAVVPVPGSRPRIAAVSGGAVIALEADGRIVGRFAVPSATGRLRRADLDGDGHAELVGFRPGGGALVFIDLRDGKAVARPSPAPVLDVNLQPAAPPSRPSGTVALATTGGLYLAGASGADPRLVAGTGETEAVDGAGEGTLAALGADGMVRWIGPDGRITGSLEAPPGAFRLVAGPSPSEGAGTAPAAVAAVATGRFIGAGGRQVAAITSSGFLDVVRLDTGAVVFRARWPDLREAIAGDLDGDGRDELVVASGRAIAVLRAAR